MHRENLIIAALAVALCLPFLRMLTVPVPFATLPAVVLPHR